MKLRTLAAVWKANVPPMVWLCAPLWIAPLILGLDGRTPQWAPIGVLLAALATIMAIAEFANTYTDRNEDTLYFPSSPLVTGDLSRGTALRALVLQNILAVALIVALAVLTRSYALTLALTVCWLVCLTYSVPPLRFKETAASPLFVAAGIVLQPIAAWLLVAPMNALISGFAVFLFLHTFGFGVTQKLRKTHHASSAGLIRSGEGGSVYSLRTVGLGLTVRTAVLLEAVASLGAFILVSVFWALGVFDAALAVGLLALPLPLTVIYLMLRVRGPVENGPKCALLMTMAWGLIGLVLLAGALATLVNWGLAVLVCVAFLAVSILLTRSMHPFSFRAITAPWQEL
jgi:hypothetical protein